MNNAKTLDIFSEDDFEGVTPPRLFWMLSFLTTISNRSQSILLYRHEHAWICCFQDDCDRSQYFDLPLPPPHISIERIRSELVDLFGHDTLCDSIEGKPDGHLELNL